MNLTKIANGLTIIRLIVIPLFLISIIYFYSNSTMKFFCYVFFIYLIASDLIDGYLARKSGDANYIGNFIDPLADKLFLGMGFIFMVVFWKKPPLWVMLIIAGRYAIIGFLWYAALAVSKEKFSHFLTMDNVITTPNLLGKAATWSEVVLFGMLIFQFPSFIISIFYIIVPSISIATGSNYLYLTLKTIKNYKSVARTSIEKESLMRMNDFLIKYKIFKDNK